MIAGADRCDVCGASVETMTVEIALGMPGSAPEPRTIRKPCPCRVAAAAESERIAAERHEHEIRATVKQRSRVPDVFADAALSDFAPHEQIPMRHMLLQIRDTGFRPEMLRGSYDVVKRARMAVAGMKGVAFVSPRFRVGKSRRAAAILNEARKALIPGQFVSITSLFTQIGAAIDGGASSKSQIVARYRDCPLLVLDDIDKFSATGPSAATFFDIINQRIEDRMPIIITANALPKELAATTFRAHPVTGKAIIRRLGEACDWISVGDPA